MTVKENATLVLLESSARCFSLHLNNSISGGHRYIISIVLLYAYIIILLYELLYAYGGDCWNDRLYHLRHLEIVHQYLEKTNSPSGPAIEYYALTENERGHHWLTVKERV